MRKVYRRLFFRINKTFRGLKSRAGCANKRLKIDVVSDKGEYGIRRYYVAAIASNNCNEHSVSPAGVAKGRYWPEADSRAFWGVRKSSRAAA